MPTASSTDRPTCGNPLIVIGDYAGAAGPIACGRRSGDEQATSRARPSLGIMLLADCRRVMGISTGSPLSTCSGCSTLLEDHRGATSGVSRSTPEALARRLRPYDVRPAKHRFGETTAKGYLRTDFFDAWTRYLPLPPPGKGNKGNKANATRTSHRMTRSNTSRDWEAAFPRLFGAAEGER